MSIDVFLTESNWKSVGLSKRTAAEKQRIKKTGVSEALRAYAQAERLGLDRGPEKATKLKGLRTVFTKCKKDHSTNAALVALLTNMESAIGREATRLNKVLNDLTLEAILRSPAHTASFDNYCRNDQHNPEPFDFLRAAAKNAASPALIAKFIVHNAPSEVNISHEMKEKWIKAPADSGARQAVIVEVAKVVKENELPRFKVKYKVSV